MMGAEFLKRLLCTLASFLFISAALAVGITAASNELVLEEIEFIVEDDKPEQVVFKLNGAHTPKSFRLDGDNPRLVFDFYGVNYPSEIYRIDDIGGGIIATIRVGRHYDPPKIRVVVDIQKDSPYLHEQTFNVSNNSLVVTFTPDVAQISKLPEPTPEPPRIEADSTKLVLSSSQQKPEAEPSVPDEEETAQAQDTTVEIAETPPEKNQEPTKPSLEEETESPVATAPPAPPESTPAAQPSEPIGTEQPTQVAKPEPSVEPQRDQPTQVAKPEPPVEPQRDQPAQVAKPEPPVEPQRDQPTQVAKPEPSVEPQSDQPTQVARPEPPVEPQSTEPADIVPVLLDVSFEKSINESETVLFRLNHFYPPLVFGIEKGEPRVVCDFFDAEIDDNVPREIEAGGQFVNRIMVTNESDPDKVRVELVLMPNRNYDLQQLFFKEDNLFVVIVKELPEDSAAAN